MSIRGEARQSKRVDQVRVNVVEGIIIDNSAQRHHNLDRRPSREHTLSLSLLPYPTSPISCLRTSGKFSVLLEPTQFFL